MCVLKEAFSWLALVFLFCMIMLKLFDYLMGEKRNFHGSHSSQAKTWSSINKNSTSSTCIHPFRSQKKINTNGWKQLQTKIIWFWIHWSVIPFTSVVPRWQIKVQRPSYTANFHLANISFLYAYMINHKNLNMVFSRYISWI